MKKLYPALVMLLLISCNKRPEKNSVFYRNIGSAPSSLNPISSQTEGSAVTVLGYVFESLLTKDIDSYEWKPALAKEWKVSKDKLSFKFVLRDNLKWSDGTPLTSEDVKYSFDIIFKDKFNAVPIRPYYEGIKEVKIIDERTVEFIAKDKQYKNFDVAAGLTVIPKHHYDVDKKKSYFNKNVLGSGPYKIEFFKRGSRILLAKNNLWWGFQQKNNKEWNFKKIVLRFVKDEMVQMQMLKKGSLDFLGLRPDMYIKHTKGKVWGKDVHKVKVTSKAPSGYTFIGWNLKDAILKDKKVRIALNHLINRELMIQKFEYDMKILSQGPVHPGSPYFAKNLPQYDFNPKKSLRLLRSAGWKDLDGDNILDKYINGKKYSLRITILEPYQPYEKYLTIFKEDAKKAGVEINIRFMEWNSFVKMLDEKNFQAIRLAWSSTVDWDPRQIWHSKSIKGGSNFISYSNPKADKLIDQSKYIYDRAERIKVLSLVQKMIVEDAPYAWLITGDLKLYGVADRIEKEKDTYNYGIGLEFWKFKSEFRKK